MSDDGCLFCRIVAGDAKATIVYENKNSLAFLDIRPLFHGHVLVVPRVHIETLGDLPATEVDTLFQTVRLLSQAVERGMDAEGSFVAMNNRVSQSVPHLHVHVVPRRKKDGLKGFFWPRTKYTSEEQMNEVRERIVAELQRESI
jgi:histidine triad (HIT) family protein